MVLFGFVFALRVLFFVFLCFYLGFYFVEFLSCTHQKKKKKSICRLDMKNLVFFVLKLPEVINLKSSFCLLFVNCIFLYV